MSWNKQYCSKRLVNAFSADPQAEGKNGAVLNAGNGSGGGNRTSRVGFEMDRLQDTADVHSLEIKRMQTRL